MCICSGNKTNHISSRFFFIFDKISKGDVDVDNFPTEKMWCGILNKPKQGAPYRLYLGPLINFPVVYCDKVKRKATRRALMDTNQDDNI